MTNFDCSLEDPRYCGYCIGDDCTDNQIVIFTNDEDMNEHIEEHDMNNQNAWAYPCKPCWHEKKVEEYCSICKKEDEDE